MKDYVTQGDMNSINKLLELAEKLNCYIECFEGSLIDNYIIYDAQKIKIGRAKSRKYIILVEKYLNSWSSTTEVIMTDNDKTVRKYEEIFNR